MQQDITSSHHLTINQSLSMALNSPSLSAVRVRNRQEFEQQFYKPKQFDLNVKKQVIKCDRNNQTIYLCNNPLCKKSALICESAKCECQNSHKNCSRIFFDKIIEGIKRDQIQNPQTIKQSFETIFNILDNLKKQIQQIRMKFLNIQDSFGLKKQQIKFLQIVKQNKLHKYCGNDISKLQKLINCQPELLLPTKKYIDKIAGSIRQEFNQLKLFLNSLIPKQKKIPIANFLNDSLILKDPYEKSLISSWIYQRTIKDIQNLSKQNNHCKFQRFQSNLLYRASANQYQSKKFHENCRQVSQTLILAQDSNNQTIGAFTTLPWKTPQRFWSKSTFADQKSSFIFSLRKKDLITPVFFVQSIYCDKNSGPQVFGGTYNSRLKIVNKCNAQNSCIFKFPKISKESLFGQINQQKQEKITIKQYQVFLVNRKMRKLCPQ